MDIIKELFSHVISLLVFLFCLRGWNLGLHSSSAKGYNHLKKHLNEHSVELCKPCELCYVSLYVIS